MLDNPKISVIMSVYNGEKYLRKAIESVLSQTFTGFDFIIVNDGSTDDSLRIIQSYHDERIRVINNEWNIGLTKSLNKAIKESCAEYIARQDADDISLPNRFDEQMQFFEKHPEVSLLGTSIYRIDSNGKMTGKMITLAKPTMKDLFKGNQFNHGSVMVKRRVLDDVGGYNELCKYAQDHDLWLRIAKHYEVRNLTKILYKLRSHNKNVRFTNGEEAVLYSILAPKLTKESLEEEILEDINEKGIRSLYQYLSKDEEIVVHKAKASLHTDNGNIKLAREEYKKIFSLTPFDLENDINIMRSYFGRDMMIKSSKLYEHITNLYKYLKNWYSK
ncbi:glycosyltransferase [bacterium]|jgi:glycosyltransferase involved in cell wall biosynthesis|nr:glycosyltransferase [bacterium]TET75502.1 MAG: glycosyltransferase [Candidatus Aminicenantes bacterium]